MRKINITHKRFCDRVDSYLEAPYYQRIVLEYQSRMYFQKENIDPEESLGGIVLTRFVNTLRNDMEHFETDLKVLEEYESDLTEGFPEYILRNFKNISDELNFLEEIDVYTMKKAINKQRVYLKALLRDISTGSYELNEVEYNEHDF